MFFTTNQFADKLWYIIEIQQIQIDNKWTKVHQKWKKKIIILMKDFVSYKKKFLKSHIRAHEKSEVKTRACSSLLCFWSNFRILKSPFKMSCLILQFWTESTYDFTNSHIVNYWIDVHNFICKSGTPISYTKGRALTIDFKCWVQSSWTCKYF